SLPPLAPPRPPLLPYTTLFRSRRRPLPLRAACRSGRLRHARVLRTVAHARADPGHVPGEGEGRERWSDAQPVRALPASVRARLRSEEHTSNSSHVAISYAVFCL